ncbi:AGE family epimerase/isomerase [Arcticibacter eurypsychrophilus]|uniref:AGE family epimerase/isomerase n=1 Tax=Arcticibacter eurypsychrophilus TaxID=1434752 RepID=UPI00084DBA2F|nr:AGE family epimerase/isomerase [Arcticibacter eurypsychrophilus]
MAHRITTKYYLLGILLLSVISFTIENEITERSVIAADMELSARKNLIEVWYPKSVDTVYGGFLSTFNYKFEPLGPQDKMIVTQSRHVWSNSKAAIFFKNSDYKEYAAQGVKFLRDVMWDKTYGGFYTLVDRQGHVKRFVSPKDSYGNAFAIYALSAYYQASGDTNALNLAKNTFFWLEKNSHDTKNKGYFQHLSREGFPIKRTTNTPSTAELGYKDQNSSIHLLEAFTELYTVWPNALLRERLLEMFYLVRDKITTPQSYLNLFFQTDWTPVSTRDSSYKSILKHRGLDHVSFGHDIETAYLLIEASLILGLKDHSATLQKGKSVVDHALNFGYDYKLGGFYDEGYYFKDKPGVTIIKDSKTWWAQAEGMNTLLLMSEHFPKDKQDYYGKFKQMWRYINVYLIDKEHGDWYMGGIDKEPEMKLALKGQIWKGTYHNFRALMNCITHLKPDHIAPQVPSTAKVITSVDKVFLKWAKSTDDQNLIGYNIYLNGERIGFTPLDSFQIEGYKKGIAYSVKAIDFQGNQSTTRIATIN